MIIQTGRRIMFYSFVAWLLLEFAMLALYSFMPMQFWGASIYITILLGVIFIIGLVMWINGRIRGGRIVKEIKSRLH